MRFPGKPTQTSQVVEESQFNSIVISTRGLEVIRELVKPDNLTQKSIV